MMMLLSSSIRVHGPGGLSPYGPPVPTRRGPRTLWVRRLRQVSSGVPRWRRLSPWRRPEIPDRPRWLRRSRPRGRPGAFLAPLHAIPGDSRGERLGSWRASRLLSVSWYLRSASYEPESYRVTVHDT